jgi:hypothetical protein
MPIVILGCNTTNSIRFQQQQQQLISPNEATTTTSQGDKQNASLNSIVCGTNQ